MTDDDRWLAAVKMMVLAPCPARDDGMGVLVTVQKENLSFPCAWRQGREASLATARRALAALGLPRKTHLDLLGRRCEDGVDVDYYTARPEGLGPCSTPNLALVPCGNVLSHRPMLDSNSSAAWDTLGVPYLGRLRTRTVEGDPRPSRTWWQNAA